MRDQNAIGNVVVEISWKLNILNIVVFLIYIILKMWTPAWDFEDKPKRKRYAIILTCLSSYKISQSDV